MNSNWHLEDPFSFLPFQQLSGIARFSNGTVAENKIRLRFCVEDENDNSPVFAPDPPATVYESCLAGKSRLFSAIHTQNTKLRFEKMKKMSSSSVFRSGTLVGVVNATDADKPNTYNSKISYSIVKQEPSDGDALFYIDRHTGSLYVRDNTLDREVRRMSVLGLFCSDSLVGG